MPHCQCMPLQAGPSEAPSWGEASSEAELAERHAAALAAQRSRPLGLVERQDSANYQPRPPAMTERQDSARNLQVRSRSACFELVPGQACCLLPSFVAGALRLAGKGGRYRVRPWACRPWACLAGFFVS